MTAGKDRPETQDFEAEHYETYAERLRAQWKDSTNQVDAMIDDGCPNVESL